MWQFDASTGQVTNNIICVLREEREGFWVDLIGRSD